MNYAATRRVPGKVYAYDMLAAAWVSAGRAGLNHKPVRADRERGQFLGLIGFDPLTHTGLHQHLGTAISYFLDGSLVDYGGEAVRGQAGINLAGATHDAIAYNRCLLAARLEGPVRYHPEAATDHELHTGALHGEIVNPAPEVMPDINITVADLPVTPTLLAGVTRRMVFDYRATGDNRRLVQLQLLPGTRVPAHVTSGLVDWFVLGGDVTVNGARATGGGFVVIEPEEEVVLSTRFGALLLAWAEGPVEWSDRDRLPDLYGF